MVNNESNEANLNYVHTQQQTNLLAQENSQLLQQVNILNQDNSQLVQQVIVVDAHAHDEARLERIQAESLGIQRSPAAIRNAEHEQHLRKGKHLV